MSEHEGRQAEETHESFVPRGAIAFMVAMIVAYGVVWLLFYLLMTGRS